LKALILAAGSGTRLAPLTAHLPKCLLPLPDGRPLLGAQLDHLKRVGIQDVAVAVGAFAHEVEAFLRTYANDLRITPILNPDYERTNYIASMHLAAGFCNDELVLLHGDLVFSSAALNALVTAPGRNVAAVRLGARSGKDFLARIQSGRITQIGVGLSGDDCSFLAPVYRFCAAGIAAWMKAIQRYIREGRVLCYAEDALNELLPSSLDLHPCAIGEELCMEVDDWEDLKRAWGRNPR
jgi:choline kinase